MKVNKHRDNRVKAINKAIDKFWRENCLPPSIRDIGNAVGISSTSLVRYYLNILAERGDIQRTDRLSRGIIPVWVKAAVGNAASNSQKLVES